MSFDELAEKIIAKIRNNKLSTTEIADCLGKKGAIEGVFPLIKDKFLVGKVFFAYAYNESNWELHGQLQHVSKGDVVVVKSYNCNNRAIFGELVSKYLMMNKKAAAIVVDGYLRDAREITKEGYPIWCKGITPIGCFNKKNEEPLNEEIIREWKKKYGNAIAVCDEGGVVIIEKENITPQFLEALDFIELQEAIWFYCIDVKGWSTYETVCLKKYVDTELLPPELRERFDAFVESKESGKDLRIKDKTKLNPEEGARRLVVECGRIKKNERILIIVDKQTIEIGNLLFKAAKEITDHVKIIESRKESMHGIEPPQEVALAMEDSDVIFGLTTFSLAHTQARINACKKGARYLSLPDYSLGLLSRDALYVNFQERAVLAKKLKEILDQGSFIRITSQTGTSLSIEAASRIANYCPGFCDEPGMLSSPPDIETNIAPLEEKSNGILVVDGSIPCKELGLIKEPIVLTVASGMIIDVDKSTEQGRILSDVLEKDADCRRKILAEFGIGLNDKAELCGIMLEDEGCNRTVHFGFGSNNTIGGKNKVGFHLDFVIKEPSVEIDGRIIMKDGKLVI